MPLPFDFLYHTRGFCVRLPSLKKCKYGVVQACALDMGWSVRKEVKNGSKAGGENERRGAGRWDLFWTDTSVSLQVRPFLRHYFFGSVQQTVVVLAGTMSETHYCTQQVGVRKQTMLCATILLTLKCPIPTPT